MDNSLKPLNTCQNGFRGRGSTQSSLCAASNDIFDAMNSREQVLGISLDLSNAFDHVNHD